MEAMKDSLIVRKSILLICQIITILTVVLDFLQILYLINMFFPASDGFVDDLTQFTILIVSSGFIVTLIGNIISGVVFKTALTANEKLKKICFFLFFVYGGCLIIMEGWYLGLAKGSPEWNTISTLCVLSLISTVMSSFSVCPYLSHKKTDVANFEKVATVTDNENRGTSMKNEYKIISLYYDNEELIAIPCGKSERYTLAAINLCFCFPLPLTAVTAKRLFDRVLNACYCMPADDTSKRCAIEYCANLRSFRKVMERYRLVHLEYFPKEKSYYLTPTSRDKTGYLHQKDLRILVSDKMAPEDLLCAFQQVMELSR